MKNLCKICVISTVVLTCCILIQAQPATGSWMSEDGDFPAGSWIELFTGGGEGQPYNEIRAESPGYYTFYNATIGDPSGVVLLQDCSDPEYLSFIYRTFYYGGILELDNDGTPWGNGGGSPFLVTMGPVKNITTKSVDGISCNQTAEISFDLTTVGIFDAFPEYAALVTAHYIGEPIFDGSGTPSMSDDLDEATIIIARRIPVYVKPGSCKNPVNVKSQGVIPVVVMGTESVDLTTIDPSQVTLEGVQPSHWAWEDVGGPIDPVDGGEEPDCSATEIPDGFTDLVLKFSTQEVIAAIAPVEDGDMVTLTLLGETEEYPVLGQDVITILKRGRIRVGTGDAEERENNGNHYGWTNGNGHAYGRHKNVHSVLGRGRSEGNRPDEGEEAGYGGNPSGREKDKEKNKDKENGSNNGKEDGSDKGNGNKNGQNKNGG